MCKQNVNLQHVFRLVNVARTSILVHAQVSGLTLSALHCLAAFRILAYVKQN